MLSLSKHEEKTAGMTDDERAIRNLVETWIAATEAGDFATVLNLMADDVVFMVPGQAPFGKEVLAAASEKPSNVRIEGSSDIQEVQVLGGWAYLRTYLEVAMTPDGGEPVRRSGYTLTILRKEPDGRWVIARDANLLTAET
ncbi:MAG: YybH family protein [Kiloniellales bacterium]